MVARLKGLFADLQKAKLQWMIIYHMVYLGHSKKLRHKQLPQRRPFMSLFTIEAFRPLLSFSVAN